MTDEPTGPPPPPAPPPPPGVPAGAPPPPTAPGPPTGGQLHGGYAGAQVYGTVPPTNGYATAALVLGILSLLLFWAFGVGIVLGILAVVFGILGRNRAKEMATGGNQGRATAGIVTGALGTIGGALFIVLIVVLVDDLEFDTDPPDGFCDTDRILQDPDC